ncbi:MAG TPA: cytochrome c3 family protein [Spongiibacteraceae bacterium]
MPQVFSLRRVLLIKLGSLVLLIVVAATLVVMHWQMQYPNAVGAPVRQPIPFSHKHHVGDDGIDCRYCHTSVERGSSAGLPSTQICLSCHSQLFSDANIFNPLFSSMQSNRSVVWTRVHDLPDFVYFDHSIHVAKGVACVECHGRIDQMPLTWRVASLDMQWCLDCHRAPQPHLHAANEIFAMPPPAVSNGEQLSGFYHLRSRQRLTDCSTCHR